MKKKKKWKVQKSTCLCVKIRKIKEYTLAYKHKQEILESYIRTNNKGQFLGIDEDLVIGDKGKRET